MLCEIKQTYLSQLRRFPAARLTDNNNDWVIPDDVE